ncbi:hypothetical protein K2173_003916 [Erythroxylum novogranatense]|uniref:Beta-lactamase-related domain-containing protein n=1 Tax=Erythroxylum novogranatense TaxID=1862640 RepID=A0AAV8SK48_9ROSI|nr:hypothetical protein K2173_003916 [Erythroxylum novogranatense]
MNTRTPIDSTWIHDSPVQSEVEAKLRQLLLELGNCDKILGIQVCAYKDGEVIIDTSAGVFGPDDPRPVQPDTLFPVFSVTKGITSGMLHWLVDKRKLQLDENVANIWPEFGTNGKDNIKVHHVLNHTSGLPHTYSLVEGEDPLQMADWNGSLNRIAHSIPETEPGKQQRYRSSFGWLCGGIIERASGKKFQEVLEEAIVRPLKIDGELYIRIPAGVESRLASLALDEEDIKKLSEFESLPHLLSPLQPEDLAKIFTAMPCRMRNNRIRRAIIPSSNGHCSARALARYYAALVDGGVIPPPHSNLSKPSLGSHPHIPEQDKQVLTTGMSSPISMFDNPKIHEAFLGVGEYGRWVHDGPFGLGFRRMRSEDGSYIGFGHSGMGGSTGFCDIKSRFAIAVTLNKMSLGTVTGKIIQLVCYELNTPLPSEFSGSDDKGGDGDSDVTRIRIN